MQEKDAVSNEFFKDSIRMADLLNGFIYRGQQVIRAEDVHKRGEQIYRIDGKKGGIEAETVTLDVANEVINGMQVTLVSLQNQSAIHYAMPVRVMNEEAIYYHEGWKQIAERHQKKADLKGVEYLSGFAKNDKLMPIITIVLYWGKQPWDGPKRLKDLLDLDNCPLELQKFIVDYPIHLLEVRQYEYLDDFLTDIKYVFGFLQRDMSKEALATYVDENKDVFSELNESAYNLISIMSSCDRLKLIKKDVKREGVYDMCEAIEAMVEEGRKEGCKEGCELTCILFKKLMQDDRMSDVKKAMEDYPYLQKLLEEYRVE